MVLGVGRDLLTEKLCSIAVDSRLLSIPAGMGPGQFLSRGIVSKLKELAPSSGVVVGIPAFDGDSARAEIATDVDGSGESHVVGSGAGSQPGELESPSADGGAIVQNAGIASNGIDEFGSGLKGISMGDGGSVSKAHSKAGGEDYWNIHGVSLFLLEAGGKFVKIFSSLSNCMVVFMVS